MSAKLNVSAYIHTGTRTWHFLSADASAYKFPPIDSPSSVCVFTHGLTMGDQSQHTHHSAPVTRCVERFTRHELGFKRCPMGEKAPRASEWQRCQNASRSRFDLIFTRLLFLSEGLSADKPLIKRKREKENGRNNLFKLFYCFNDSRG